MKLISRLAPLVAALALACTLTACGSSGGSSAVSAGCKPAHQVTTVQKGKLTAASYDLLPYTQVAGSKLEGLEGDTLQAVADMECLQLVGVNSSPAAAITEVQNGRVDTTAACWYRTKARAQITTLSAPTFADEMALISKSGITDLTQIKSKGLKVGTLTGYLWDDDLSKFLGPNVKLYSSTANVYGDLKAGRIDVVADSSGAGVVNGKGFKVEKAQPNSAVAASEHPAQCNFPMQKSNPGLATAMDADIATLRAKGTLASLAKKYDIDPSAANPGPPSAI